MSENKTQFVIEQDGRIFREDLKRTEIDPGPTLGKAFNKGLSFRFRNVMDLEDHGPCHMVYEVDTNTQYWSVPMPVINFRAAFAAGTKDLGNEGEIYPVFNSKKDTQTLMEVPWNIRSAMNCQDYPAEMRFVAIVRSDAAMFYCENHYLYAFDNKKAAYQLPLPNLYETCQICMGYYDSYAATALGAVKLALKQFWTAPWNTDLMPDLEMTRRLARFKPLDKGFETLPIEGDWRQLCLKVATANLKFVEV